MMRLVKILSGEINIDKRPLEISTVPTKLLPFRRPVYYVWSLSGADTSIDQSQTFRWSQENNRTVLKVLFIWKGSLDQLRGRSLQQFPIFSSSLASSSIQQLDWFGRPRGWPAINSTNHSNQRMSDSEDSEELDKETIGKRVSHKIASHEILFRWGLVAWW